MTLHQKQMATQETNTATENIEIVFSESEEEVIPTKKRKQDLKIKEDCWASDVCGMIIYYTNMSDCNTDADVISYDCTSYEELPSGCSTTWLCVHALSSEATSKWLNVHLCKTMCFVNYEKSVNLWKVLKLYMKIIYLKKKYWEEIKNIT